MYIVYSDDVEVTTLGEMTYIIYMLRYRSTLPAPSVLQKGFNTVVVTICYVSAPRWWTAAVRIRLC